VEGNRTERSRLNPRMGKPLKTPQPASRLEKLRCVIARVRIMDTGRRALAARSNEKPRLWPAGAR